MLLTMTDGTYKLAHQFLCLYKLRIIHWLYRCEYIFYRGLYRTSYLRMSRGKITDTELQVGQFVVPPFGQRVADDSEDARYLRKRKEELPVEHVSLDRQSSYPSN